MCTVVHLEPEDFARELVHNPKNVYARTYVLDCGLAVVIYMCQDSHFLYYLDRPDCSKEKKDMLKSMNFYELHAENYRKVNLDNRLRERQKKTKLLTWVYLMYTKKEFDTCFSYRNDKQTGEHFTFGYIK